MEKKIAVIRGDGIGPEIVEQALLALNTVAQKYGHTFSYMDVWAGGCSTDRFGVPLTDEAVAACKEADAVLLGAVGGPKWDTLPAHLRPEKALLGLRKELGLFANLRPTKLFPQLMSSSPLSPALLENGLDLLIVRELTGGVYFGERKTSGEIGSRVAVDEMKYSEEEIERIGRVGFETARKRRGTLCSVDKANVLDTSRLWRDVMHRIAPEYPDVTCTDMLVDNCAMQLVRNPGQFDVMVTENMFGDILSDEASMLTGSIGMMPSASLGNGTLGMYEPIHGSAPDIAGQDIANPLGTIMSAAMLLSYSFGMAEEAAAIERAVFSALEDGLRTSDLARAGTAPLSCSEMGAAVAKRI